MFTEQNQLKHLNCSPWELSPFEKRLCFRFLKWSLLLGCWVMHLLEAHFPLEPIPCSSGTPGCCSTILCTTARYSVNPCEMGGGCITACWPEVLYYISGEEVCERLVRCLQRSAISLPFAWKLSCAQRPAFGGGQVIPGVSLLVKQGGLQCLLQLSSCQRGCATISHSCT